MSDIYKILQKLLLVPEAVSFGLALFVLVKRNVNTAFRIFFVILLLAVVVEGYGWFTTAKEQFNVNIYNYYEVIVISFWFMLFSILLEGRNKYFTFIFLGLYWIGIIIEWSFFNDYRTLTQVIAYVLGAIGMTVCVLLYFLQILSSQYRSNLYSDLYFWICLGVLIFYTVGIPFRAVANLYTFEVVQNQWVFFILRILLAITMYSLFTIGLIKYIKNNE